MIHIVTKGVIWKDPNAQIIFNPVSNSKSKLGQSIFNSNIKHEYPKVYNEYREYMIGESKRRLLGEIQLVQIESKKLIMNGFVYDGNVLCPKAIMKTFVELSNLIEEYEISAAIPYNLGCKDEEMIKEIEQITNVIFCDCKQDVFVYKKKIRK